ncbi:MAG: eL32 family ribosomal protein [Candidatus ainarchaeum sp.]|nr:eL32 family ribosomal protein [Candidatus ainarchaeum sp.]MDD3975763.1 eL32 family ribosomal protein [Candidatus ainarchaeum sp.]
MSKDTPNFRGHFPLTTRRRKKRRDVTKWRRPRGIDSTLATPRGPIPKVGYGHKNEDKYKHPSNLKEVLVCSMTDFDNIFLEEPVAIRFSSTLGKKKKEDIRKLAMEKNIKVLN